MDKWKKYFIDDRTSDDSDKSNKFANALDFYFKKVPEFSEKLRSALLKISKNKHTKLYQAIGDNIRSSGEALKNNFSPKNIGS